MPYGWLTPDSIPASTTCRAIFIPDDPAWIAIVTGALNALVDTWNYEQFGALTPQQTADGFVDMFDQFCLKQGFCRMIGEIIPFAGATSPYPGKWLACDGSSLARADYPDLFTVIGIAYGAIDGLHFNLPDLRGRAAIGIGTGSGLSPRSLGDNLGEEDHTLIVSETPSHAHTDTGHTHTTNNSIILGTSAPPPLDALGPNPIPAISGSGNANLTSTGGDGPHNNMQPSLAINYLIVALN